MTDFFNYLYKTKKNCLEVNEYKIFYYEDCFIGDRYRNISIVKWDEEVYHKIVDEEEPTEDLMRKHLELFLNGEKSDGKLQKTICYTKIKRASDNESFTYLR